MLDRYLREYDDRDWVQEGDSPDGTVRFAMVGVGWWVREEAIPAVAEAEWCETTAVVSGSREKARSVVEEWDAIETALTYEEFHDGVDSDAYDAVYVCTPNGTHLEHVETAADLGKAVLCEKPMEATVERARQLVDVADRRDATLMIAYRMQTEPLVRRAKELLADGAVGDPVQIHSHISGSLLDLIPDENQWRLDADLAGGCALIDIGIYPLNTIRFLLDAEPTHAAATVRNTHEAFADVDENVWFELQFPDAVGAMCTASHNAHPTSDLRVVGREGAIELTGIYHPWSDRDLILEVGDTRTRITSENVNQMTEEFDYFAYCLLTGTEPAPDGRHGLRDMEIIDRLYEAADSGERTELPSP
jgi:xylose dehydrogenase (NAD/NADP)